MVTTFIFFEKRFLRAEPEATIWDLTSMAALSTLAAEIIFQLIRQFTIKDSTEGEHLVEYLRSVILMSVMEGLIGFLVAFQLKTKKDGWLILLIVLVLIAINLMNHFLVPS